MFLVVLVNWQSVCHLDQIKSDKYSFAAKKHPKMHLCYHLVLYLCEYLVIKWLPIACICTKHAQPEVSTV